MHQKTITTLFLMLMVVIFLLFTVTASMAVERPQKCVAGPYTVIPNPGIAAFPLFQDGTSGNVRCGEGTPGYLWSYRLDCATDRDCSKITEGVFWLPSIPGFIINVVGGPESDLKWFFRGKGDPSTTIGDGVTNGITITTSSTAGNNDPFEIFEFCTDVSTTSVVSFGVNTGKGFESCLAVDDLGQIWGDDQGPVGGIIGPGLDPLLPARQTSTATFTVSEGDLTCNISVDEGPPVIATTTGDCSAPIIKRLENMTLNNKKIESFPSNVWVKSHGSPGTFTYCYPSGNCVEFNF